MPLAALYFDGPVWALTMIFVVATGMYGLFSIFLAVVPAETVDPRRLATTVGMVLGVAELAGGVAGPALAGVMADIFGLQAPLWMMAAVCAPACVLGLFMDETAPRFALR
jgi:cyanate permease